MQLRDTIRHYSWVIRYHLWFIILGTLVCTAATFAVSVCLPPVYQAAALVIVNGSTGTGSNDVFSNQALALSYSLLVNRDDVLQGVAQKLHGMSVSQLKKAVSDSPVDNTQIIEIRAQADNPKLAADIANAVAGVFIQIESTKEATNLQNLAGQLSQNLLTAKNNLDTAQAQLTTLLSSHASTESITRQRNLLDTDQTNYDSLLATYHQLQQRELQASNILSVAQLATPPDKPVSPQIALNTAVAVIMGLLLMVTLALVLDWMDSTIQTPEDVIHLAALEPLGSVPLSTAPSNKSRNLSMLNNQALREALITIGTNFIVLSKEKRLILVTGPRSGAGASTIAVNLSISLAQSGMRVLLVDANLRRPVLHEVLSRPNTAGLVNSLPDMQMFQDHSSGLRYSWLNQWKTHIPNLWLLPTGPMPAYLSTILRMLELRTLLACLLGQAPTDPEQTPSRLVDVIIFDTSPLEEGGDTIALAPITDATLLVVEAGKEQRETLEKAHAMLQRLGAPILGVVINRQQAKHRSYFYADHYQARAARPESAPAKTLIEPDRLVAQSLPSETPPHVSAVPMMASPQASAVPETPPLAFMSPVTPLIAAVPEMSMQVSEAAGALSNAIGESSAASDAQTLSPLKSMRGISLPGLQSKPTQRINGGGLRQYLDREQQNQQ